MTGNYRTIRMQELQNISCNAYNCMSFVIDRPEDSCYPEPTLCTAYKSTVQTEQTVIDIMESGHISGSGIFIHGTVAANTGSWVFFNTSFKRLSSKIPTYIGVIELSYIWR